MVMQNTDTRPYSIPKFVIRVHGTLYHAPDLRDGRTNNPLEAHVYVTLKDARIEQAKILVACAQEEHPDTNPVVETLIFAQQSFEKWRRKNQKAYRKYASQPLECIAFSHHFKASSEKILESEYAWVTLSGCIERVMFTNGMMWTNDGDLFEDCFVLVTPESNDNEL